ncbi:hypothetical protein [Streptomyces sp. NBC_01565]|uniref:hypothetical protein n=1 Tax=Streptomyces sp. NBC_01565 TaxID=2975881 RepID=UPI0022586534|nr:hypothetical protein [Streptomyces sp. NBC_01565]MCX4541813.1 hypothetical protein [Streptomyces sp. NBC_01565]
MTRANSGVRWRHAIPILIGFGIGIFAFSVAVPRLVTQLTGVEGTFVAERCRWEENTHGERHAACTGSFTAADGSFTLRGIDIDGLFDERPTQPMAARVSGPSADTVVQTDLLTSLLPIGIGVLACIFPVWAVIAAVRDAIGRRRGTIGDGSAAGEGGAGGEDGAAGDGSPAGDGSAVRAPVGPPHHM